MPTSENFGALPPRIPRPGPWFIAEFDGECSNCGGEFGQDESIRADGEGGWECSNCVPGDPCD